MPVGLGVMRVRRRRVLDRVERALRLPRALQGLVLVEGNHTNPGHGDRLLERGAARRALPIIR